MDKQHEDALELLRALEWSGPGGTVGGVPGHYSWEVRRESALRSCPICRGLHPESIAIIAEYFDLPRFVEVVTSGHKLDCKLAQVLYPITTPEWLGKEAVCG